MPHQETGGYCRQCQRNVVVRRPDLNHVLHLLLTLLSAGLWLIVWIGESVRFRGWICSSCGSKATTSIPSNAPVVGPALHQIVPPARAGNSSGFLHTLGKGAALLVLVPTAMGIIFTIAGNSLKDAGPSHRRVGAAAIASQPLPNRQMTKMTTAKAHRKQTPPAREVRDQDEPIAVPSDPTAKYYVIERGGTSARPVITTKRIGKSGTSYSRREYDCKAGTFRYLGDGDTIAEMNASTPDETMGPLVDESISKYIGRVACQ